MAMPCTMDWSIVTFLDVFNSLLLLSQLHSIDRVIFCLFLQVDLHQYQKWMQAYFPIPGANGADKRVSDKGIPDKTSKLKDSILSILCKYSVIALILFGCRLWLLSCG